MQSWPVGLQQCPMLCRKVQILWDEGINVLAKEEYEDQEFVANKSLI